MSAAEPADHTPPALTGAGDAAVIDISTRVSTQAAQGRWTAVSSPRPDDGSDSRQKLAEHLEMTFNEHRMTLSDDDTATAYTITLDIVRGMLKGAHAKGIVDETQLEQLDALMEGMMSSPRLV